MSKSGANTSATSSGSAQLKFSSFASQVDPSFWFTLSSLKLNKWKLDASPQPTVAFYSTPLRATATGGGILELNGGAFEHAMIPDNYAMAKGWTCNFNTEEVWRTRRLSTAKELEDNFIDMMRTKKDDVLLSPALLAPFHCVCYANLKKYTFDHHFSFPVLPSKWNMSSSEPPDPETLEAVEKYIATATPDQRGFFLIRSDNTVHPLAALLESPQDPFLFGYLNSSPTSQGQPLQNLLTFLSLHSLVPSPSSITVLSFSRSPSQSKLIELVPVDTSPKPLLARWELDFSGRRVARRHNLSTLLDPKIRIKEARDLNNNLMKWRVASGINLDIIKSANIVVLGMGTLGCGVVRTLMGWGAQKFKIVDNGAVSFSNPARQSLFTFEHCISGDTKKVFAAEEAMKHIDPSVDVQSYDLTIPMPDHPNSFDSEHYNTFLDLISWADVVFLLMDTREARWLPSLVCAAQNKLVINAAVGFDSYVVMRHGVSNQEPRLGCYFCSDIVSPQNSTDNATLDQQCTVTRPGVAPISAAEAVELYVSVLQHPEQSSVGSDSSSPFGSVPHQVRGFLGTWEKQCLSGQASPYCAACGEKVIAELSLRGEDFVRQVCSRGGGAEIEKVCGLADAKQEFERGWDGDEDADDDWEI